MQYVQLSVDSIREAFLSSRRSDANASSLVVQACIQRLARFLIDAGLVCTEGMGTPSELEERKLNDMYSPSLTLNEDGPALVDYAAALGVPAVARSGDTPHDLSTAVAITFASRADGPPTCAAPDCAAKVAHPGDTCPLHGSRKSLRGALRTIMATAIGKLAVRSNSA